MKNKLVRFIAVCALAAVFCVLVTACGDEPPAETPEQEADSLVLAASDAGRWLSLAVEEYNESGPERPIELVSFSDSWRLKEALNDGLKADMYFTETGRYFQSELWDESADLAPYLEGSGIELAAGLAEAMALSGELRYLPWDFTVNVMTSPLESVPASIDEAERLAAADGKALYPGSTTQGYLAVMLAPYIRTAGAEAEADILESIEEFETDLKNPAQGIFRMSVIDSEPGLGLDYEEYERANGGSYSVGFPGSATMGEFVPEHVFGVLESCDDVEAAWSFLRLLCSEENQSFARSFPAMSASLSERFDELAARPSTGTHALEMARFILANTTTAVSV